MGINDDTKEKVVAFGSLKLREFLQVVPSSYIQWMFNISDKDHTCEGLKELLDYMDYITAAASGGDALAVRSHYEQSRPLVLLSVADECTASSQRRLDSVEGV